MDLNRKLCISENNVEHTISFLEKWDALCWGGDSDLHRHRLIVIRKEILSWPSVR
ncbi:conserved hypothetical protein [Xenorhabdus bovienii str. puntauvense]|uniref:Uncharacterized protein n=2 Tax=Xenorhabdus bovienii TaxID=40576 RepID=A0A0B6XDM5_XENBV|nr:conserved hypothetical protein [Xenorhabdus bovienii str. puntauvense]CDM91967.1 conserved protein of unknown function [Xenorhabdus bovienii]